MYLKGAPRAMHLSQHPLTSVFFSSIFKGIVALPDARPQRRRLWLTAKVCEAPPLDIHEHDKSFEKVGESPSQHFPVLLL